MESFSEVIQTWGRQQLTVDLAEPLGIREETDDFRRLKDRIRKWEELDILPTEHWKAILSKAPSRGIKLSPELLIDLAARE